MISEPERRTVDGALARFLMTNHHGAYFVSAAAIAFIGVASPELLWLLGSKLAAASGSHLKIIRWQEAASQIGSRIATMHAIIYLAIAAALIIIGYIASIVPPRIKALLLSAWAFSLAPYVALESLLLYGFLMANGFQGPCGNPIMGFLFLYFFAQFVLPFMAIIGAALAWVFLYSFGHWKRAAT